MFEVQQDIPQSCSKGEHKSVGARFSRCSLGSSEASPDLCQINGKDYTGELVGETEGYPSI